MDDYKRGGHTKYSLMVHLIFVTKYRKQLFRDKTRSEDVKQSLYEAADKIGCRIIRMETDKDHVHILLSYHPDTKVAEIAKSLKQYSTYRLWQLHRTYLAKQYWKRQVLWSDGYFACSIGQVSQQIIERYIKNQG